MVGLNVPQLLIAQVGKTPDVRTDNILCVIIWTSDDIYTCNNI